MPSIGKIVKWDEAKGFGFIEPAAGGRQIFVHATALRGVHRSAALGAEVSYLVATDAKGRFNAKDVKLLSAHNTPGPAAKAFVTAATFLLVVLALVALGKIPLWVALLYAGLSCVSFFLYLVDKHAARRGRWRTQESTLHLVDLAGGWPGALFAQQALRHKSSKTSFRVTFWITVLLNLAGLAYLLTSAGARLLDGIAP